MPRLKHRKSGVVISVPDERVALFPAYEQVAEAPKPAEEPVEEPKPAPKRRAQKSDTEQ